MRRSIDFGLIGYPKTSGSKGIHIYVRIEPRYSFLDVRRAALAFGREVERRRPDLVTTAMVEGRPPRRLHRLQPEQPGPDDCQRVLGAAHRLGVGTADLGRGAGRRTRRLPDGHVCGSLRAARRRDGGHRRRSLPPRSAARATPRRTRQETLSGEPGQRTSANREVAAVGGRNQTDNQRWCDTGPDREDPTRNRRAHITETTPRAQRRTASGRHSFSPRARRSATT